MTDRPVYYELPGFDHIHLDCETSAFGRVLRHLSVDPRILGDEWGYRYRPDRPFPLAAAEIARSWPPDSMLRWYGIEVRTTDHADPDAAWALLRELTGRGEAVLLSVDLYEWPMSTFHGRFGFPHRVVVAECGPDEALVLDGRGENRHIGWLDRALLARAMSTPTLTEAGERCRTMRFTAPEGEHDPRSECRSALATSCVRYFDSEQEGWRASETVLTRLREFTAGKTALADECVMPAVAFFGGAASQWQLSSLFLDFAAEQLAVDLGPAAAGFRQIAALWMRAYHIFLFGYHAGRSPIGLLRKATGRIAELAPMERTAMELLARQLAETGLRCASGG